MERTLSLEGGEVHELGGRQNELRRGKRGVGHGLGVVVVVVARAGRAVLSVESLAGCDEAVERARAKEKRPRIGGGGGDWREVERFVENHRRGARRGFSFPPPMRHSPLPSPSPLFLSIAIATVAVSLCSPQVQVEVLTSLRVLARVHRIHAPDRRRPTLE